MAEYIERENILQLWNNALKEMVPEADGKHAISFETVIRFIENYPAADVVEVVHGRWEDTGIDELDLVYGGWKCSACGYTFCGNKTNFCPDCGAKMEG